MAKLSDMAREILGQLAYTAGGTMCDGYAELMTSMNYPREGSPIRSLWMKNFDRSCDSLVRRGLIEEVRSDGIAFDGIRITAAGLRALGREA